MNLPTLLISLTLAATSAASAQIVYPASDGPGGGKHIVFLTSDHEYRSEEMNPALARILAKQGFKCTVIFGIDAQGNIEPGSSTLPGMEALQDADLLVIFARFLNPPAEDMAHLVDYLKRGGPVVGMRTSSHAFEIPKDSPNARFSYKSEDPEYEGGFGHQVLGNTWVGHYGRNHIQGTRVELVPEQKKHPILQGVPDISFCFAGGYVAEVRPDFTVLATSQPLKTMDPNSEPAKDAMACAWVRHYEAADGKKARVFHTTQGASQDILDPGFRRLLINATFWAVGLEDKITPDLNIEFVGPYKPSGFRTGKHVKGLAPADLAGFESPIPR